MGLKRTSDDWILDTCVWKFGRCEEMGNHSWYSSANSAKRDYYLHGGHLKVFTQETFNIIHKSLDAAVESKFSYTLFSSLSMASKKYDLKSRCSIHWPSNIVWDKLSLCPPAALLLRILKDGVRLLARGVEFAIAIVKGGRSIHKVQS
jgi:hypothetical protein